MAHPPHYWLTQCTAFSVFSAAQYLGAQLALAEKTSRSSTNMDLILCLLWIWCLKWAGASGLLCVHDESLVDCCSEKNRPNRRQ